ncbi:MAG: FHA domain-containing protein [Lachnospiraceae bacterium]|nr:FHA domain-containing protein [Lachnospiraceae bacterium]
MKENLPLISYERSMNHNYMVLTSPDFFGMAKDSSKSYRVRMILENRIQGLLPVSRREVNGENRYYYEINSLQSLDRLIEKNELRYQDFSTILSGCINLFERLEEYLLNGEQIIIKPDFIFINVENMEPYFVCYPDYTGDVRRSFMEFIDELLTRIDHTDERAVMLGYQVYRYTRNPNYVLSEIHKLMEHAAPAAPEKPAKREQPQKELCLVSEDANEEIFNQAWERRTVTKQDEAYGNDRDESQSKKGDIKELAGGIFCVLIALCAGTVIVGARLLRLFPLSANNELYMYAAVAMALVAAVLFFVCYVKSIRDNDDEPNPQERDNQRVYEEMFYKDVCVPLEKPEAYDERIPEALGDTVCLGAGAIEEKVLRGRVNGNEVSVPLDRLPITIGKLGGVSDFIINDNAVSKMHARFEEHGGRVCVCDLNSTNGTMRNGEAIQINTPVALEPGDKLRFGRSCFTYC